MSTHVQWCHTLSTVCFTVPSVTQTVLIYPRTCTIPVPGLPHISVALCQSISVSQSTVSLVPLWLYLWLYTHRYMYMYTCTHYGLEWNRCSVCTCPQKFCSENFCWWHYINTTKFSSVLPPMIPTRLYPSSISMLSEWVSDINSP